MAVKESARPNVTFLRFRKPGAKRMIGLLKKRDGKLSLAAAEFVKRLKGGLPQT